MFKTRGFTLIELLLVISIIALLSSIMTSSFVTGRNKAKDAAIKRQLTEMRTIMYREFSDTGTYTNLKANATTGEVSANESCPTVGTGASNLRGTYASNYRLGCEAVRAQLNGSCGTGGICIKFDAPTGVANERRFSIAAYLPYESTAAGADRYLCMGSNGRTSISNSTLNQAGCPNDAGL